MFTLWRWDTELKYWKKWKNKGIFFCFGINWKCHFDFPSGVHYASHVKREYDSNESKSLNDTHISNIVLCKHFVYTVATTPLALVITLTNQAYLTGKEMRRITSRFKKNRRKIPFRCELNVYSLHAMIFHTNNATRTNILSELPLPAACTNKENYRRQIWWVVYRWG